jgi:tetratricopeptide (TPR) repeat protein
MDQKRRIEIFITSALLLSLITSYIDFKKEDYTNIIEDNLANALDENIVVTRMYENVITDAIALVDYDLSYVHESLRGNIAGRDRNKQVLVEKTEEYKCKINNVSAEYNRSLSNSTKLKEKTEASIYWRNKINAYRNVPDSLAAILLFVALYLTMQYKGHKEIKDSIKKLEDLLIEDMGDAWNNEGRMLYDLGKYDDAIRAYNKAIKIKPQYEAAWNNKGIALEALGKTTEANAAYAKAKELGYKG